MKNIVFTIFSGINYHLPFLSNIETQVGHYTVTWAYEAQLTPNSQIETDLNVNGVKLEESHLSSYQQDTGATIGEVASKTIVSYTYESSHKS